MVVDSGCCCCLSKANFFKHRMHICWRARHVYRMYVCHWRAALTAPSSNCGSAQQQQQLLQRHIRWVVYIACTHI
jgi:hypothetical protein